MVVEAEIFPVVLTCLKDKDEYVKKNASTLIREIAKHTPEVKNKNKTPICLQSPGVVPQDLLGQGFSSAALLTFLTR